jgi:hypothetical protein
MTNPIILLMIFFVLMTWFGQDLLLSPVTLLAGGDGLSRRQRFCGRVIFSLIGIGLAAFVILTPGHASAETAGAWGTVTAIVGFWFGFGAKGGKDE